MDYTLNTFAFASDVQKFADEKKVRLVSFNTKPTTDHSGGSYDLLTVKFLVARPDRDVSDKESSRPIAEATQPISELITDEIKEAISENNTADETSEKEG